MPIDIPPASTDEEINRKKKIEAQRKVQKEIEDKTAAEKHESEIQRLLPEAKKCIAKTLGLQANLGHAFSEEEIKETFKDAEWKNFIPAALEYFKKNPNNPEKIKHEYVSMPKTHHSCLHSADMEDSAGYPPQKWFFYKEYTKPELPQRKLKPTINPPKSIISQIPREWLLLLLLIVLMVINYFWGINQR